MGGNKQQEDAATSSRIGKGNKHGQSRQWHSKDGANNDAPIGSGPGYGDAKGWTTTSSLRNKGDGGKGWSDWNGTEAMWESNKNWTAEDCGSKWDDGEDSHQKYEKTKQYTSSAPAQKNRIGPYNSNTSIGAFLTDSSDAGSGDAKAWSTASSWRDKGNGGKGRSNWDGTQTKVKAEGSKQCTSNTPAQMDSSDAAAKANSDKQVPDDSGEWLDDIFTRCHDG